MTAPKTHRARRNRTLTDEGIEALSTEVGETDYDVEASQDPATGSILDGFGSGRHRPGPGLTPNCELRSKPMPRWSG